MTAALRQCGRTDVHEAHDECTGLDGSEVRRTTTAKRVCNRCRRTIPAGPCEACDSKSKERGDRARPSSTARGYDADWRVTRAEHLRRFPYCQAGPCQRLPLARRPVATDVDHLDGLGPDGPRGHDHDNLESLCHRHHSAKTASKDGGFGNPKGRP